MARSKKPSGSSWSHLLPAPELRGRIAWVAACLGMAALTLGAILVWAVRLPPLASAPEQVRAG